MIKIKDKIIRRAGTYDRNGNKVKIPRGYQVSVHLTDMSKNKEGRLLNKLGIEKPMIYHGVWKNEDTNKLEQERSFTVMTKNEALKIAKNHNQAQIWDNKVNLAIDVKTGKYVRKD